MAIQYNSDRDRVKDGEASQARTRFDMFKTCSLLAIAFGVVGCATSQDSAYRTRSYLGWHTVQEKLTSPEDQTAVVERIKSVGLRFGPGLGFGYFDDTRIELPKECRLVIFVKDLAQLAELFNKYPQLQLEMNPCVKPNAP